MYIFSKIYSVPHRERRPNDPQTQLDGHSFALGLGQVDLALDQAGDVLGDPGDELAEGRLRGPGAGAGDGRGRGGGGGRIAGHTARPS